MPRSFLARVAREGVVKMVQKETATAEEQQEVTLEAPGEPSRVSIHIWMPTEACEQVKKYARYAALEGLIEGNPRGNFTGYCNFCFNLGEQYIKQYMLKKRGYK